MTLKVMLRPCLSDHSWYLLIAEWYYYCFPRYEIGSFQPLTGYRIICFWANFSSIRSIFWFPNLIPWTKRKDFITWKRVDITWILILCTPDLIFTIYQRSWLSQTYNTSCSFPIGIDITCIENVLFPSIS